MLTIRILSIAAIISFFAVTVHAQSVVKVSAPPSIWVQEDGDHIQGPIIDLLKNVFDESGIGISATKMPWARAIRSIENGHIDIIPVIFRTAEREKVMAFSVPYVDVPTVVFVAKGKSFPFEEIKNLVGKRGTMMRGDSISKEFENLKSELEITEVKDYLTILKMLESGRVDYAVCAKYGLLVEAIKNGYANKIEALETPVKKRTLHIAISKKSPFLGHLQKIDQKILAMKNNGAMDQLISNTLDAL